jgi:hypothetical protein
MNACVHTYTKPQTSSTLNRGPGWRIHGSVEDTKLSTNKQHTLSDRRLAGRPACRPPSTSPVLLTSGPAAGRAQVAVAIPDCSRSPSSPESCSTESRTSVYSMYCEVVYIHTFSPRTSFAGTLLQFTCMHEFAAKKAN